MHLKLQYTHVNMSLKLPKYTFKNHLLQTNFLQVSGMIDCICLYIISGKNMYWHMNTYQKLICE